MAADIVKIDPAHPDRAFSHAKRVISRGGLIVYPTDTFYGLGADPKNAAAVMRLFQMKRREPDQPILLLIQDAAHVSDWAGQVNEEAKHLMHMYWPGPLTIVLKAKDDVPCALTAGTETIGLRVPGNVLTRELLIFLNSALTGTSANLTGGRSPRTAGELHPSIRADADLILDAGPTPGGKPSTVVDVSSGRAIMIREGAIKIAE